MAGTSPAMTMQLFRVSQEHCAALVRPEDFLHHRR
jgi:hypothetical protein